MISSKDDYLNLRNRTNNALERYNRKLNEAIKGSHHPGYPQFVNIIMSDAIHYVDRVKQIFNGAEEVIVRNDVHLIAIPEQFK